MSASSRGNWRFLMRLLLYPGSGAQLESEVGEYWPCGQSERMCSSSSQSDQRSSMKLYFLAKTKDPSSSADYAQSINKSSQLSLLCLSKNNWQRPKKRRVWKSCDLSRNRNTWDYDYVVVQYNTVVSLLESHLESPVNLKMQVFGLWTHKCSLRCHTKTDVNI